MSSRAVKTSTAGPIMNMLIKLTNWHAMICRPPSHDWSEAMPTRSRSALVVKLDPYGSDSPGLGTSGRRSRDAGLWASDNVLRAPSTCRTEVAMAYDESSVLVVTPKRRRR